MLDMRRILTLIAVIMTLLGAMSCKKQIECKCTCECCNNGGSEGNDNKPEDNGGNAGGGDGMTVVNNAMRFGYLENWGVYYEDQPSNISNWLLHLSANAFNEEGWSDRGNLVVVELFSSGTGEVLDGRYTIEAFLEEYYSDFSIGDGFVDNEGYCAGTWLFENGTGTAAALSGEMEVKRNGQDYTITYDFRDTEYGIEFKGKFSGSLDVYDCTEDGNTLNAVKSSSDRKIKRQVSASRF